jgi:hypothetical protein
LPAVSLLRFDDRVTAADGHAIELTPAFMLVGPRGSAQSLAARANVLPLIEDFAREPWPRWRYRGPGWLLEREYRLIHGHTALLATWRLLEGGPLQLHVAPLLVARPLAGLQQETPEFRGAVTGIPGRVRCATVEGYAPLTLWHGGVFMPARAWHRGLAYPYDDVRDPCDPDSAAATPTEDAFLPGWVQRTLAGPGATLHVVASPEEQLFRVLATQQRLGTPPARTLADCLAALDQVEGGRRTCEADAARLGAECTARQAAAAHAAHSTPGAEPPRERVLGESFAPFVDALSARVHDALRERADRTAVLTHPARAEEHGADALRVAAGLVTLRSFGPARDIARGYLTYIDEGLAPDSFDANGQPHYESPEPSLWLVHVVDLLSRRDSESAATQSFLHDGAYRTLEGVLQHMRAGSRHGVRCDRDGFLWAGEGLAARSRADWNALWYHALVAMSQLAKRAGRRENAAFYLAWARELQRAYMDRFWDESQGCLYDAYAHAGPSRGLTPSQLYAVSLAPMLLSPERAVRLTDTVTRELFTRRGLRPRPGDGTPDPAWLGGWASATLRAQGRDATTSARVRAALERYARIGEAGAAELSARGAADLLRAWVEDLDHHATDGLLAPA